MIDAPSRLLLQKLTRLVSKMTAEATTVEEANEYVAVGIARFYMSQEVQSHMDVMRLFALNDFSMAMEEWHKTHPGRQMWNLRKLELVDKQQSFRPSSGRKPGACFHCGKPGHFSAECRSRLAEEKGGTQQTENPGYGDKKEQTVGVKGQRDMSTITCFRCRKKGHISPQCPTRTNKIKRIKIPAERLVALRKNEVFGCMSGCSVPVTLVSGADITVVPFKCVLPSQFTGEECELNSFNHVKSKGKVCNIQVTIGDKTVARRAVTQPGENLGWSVCLSLDLADDAERDLLLQQIRDRAGLKEEETWYLPPEVSEGRLLSGVLAKEAIVVWNKISKTVQGNSKESAQQEEEPMTSIELEATSSESVKAKAMKEDEVVESEVGDSVVLGIEKKDLDLGEVVGDPSGGGAAAEKGEWELAVTGIRESIPRDSLAEETRNDESLRPVYSLGELDREGYHLSGGLLFRTRIDMFSKPEEQLCIPESQRTKCLHAAHTCFGHQGRNKMLLLLRPYFYWPNMSKSCQEFVTGCIRCQQSDKSTPKPHPMTERMVATQPFQDVAVDIVGPFPTAVGGYRFMLTCFDSATRWLEAVPVRTTTAKVLITCLTDIFARCGFPTRLTSDNGSQFVGKTFTKWLRDMGIQHAKSTPYHPQGNGVVERLHRTFCPQ